MYVYVLHMSYKLGKTLHIHIQIVPITLKPGYNEPWYSEYKVN